MNKTLKYNGELVNVDGHNIHIYRTGNIGNPKIVLMSGSGTVAPVYDFKILYEKLSKNFRVIVIEKFGYGYSDIFDSPADIDTIVSTQKKALDAIGEIVNCINGLVATSMEQQDNTLDLCPPEYSVDVEAIVSEEMLVLPLRVLGRKVDLVIAHGNEVELK